MRKILLVILLLASPLVASAQYIVTDYGDVGDSTIDDGIIFPKTLRSAIQNANYRGVPASIEFSEDFKTIKLGTDLPAISVPMQFKGDGLTLEPAVPRSLVAGLIFTGDNSSIRTTVVQNFGTHGVVWRGDDGLIENLTARNNGNTNLQIWEAHRNQIGTDVVSAYASNQFYGAQYGIFLYRADDNVLYKNFVGANASYDSLPNTRYGIMVDKCNRTVLRQNVVGWNGEHGIFIDGFSSDDVTKFHSSANRLEGNFVGTSMFGTPAQIPNGMSGIMITNSTDDSVINNVVSGNLGTGIHVQSTEPGSSTAIDGRIVIMDNKIGIDRLGNKSIPNSRGVYVRALNDIILRNHVSGNRNIGIEINGADNVVQSNVIGLNADQDSALPNGIGLAIDNGFDVGHAVIGDTLLNDGNIIAGNRGAGLYVFGAGTRRVIISRNNIGVNKDTVAFHNGGDGIHMKYSLRDIVAKENLIGADSGHGIRIERNVVIFLDTTRPPLFQRPSNIRIQDNCIGCVRSADTTGKHGGSGIYVLNADSISIHNNIISGTAGHGIHIDDSVQNVWITRNDIGPFIAENFLLVRGDGIHVRGRHTALVTIGSAAEPNDANYIADCLGHGISVQDSAQMVAVFANAFLGNQLGGIALDHLVDYFRDGAHNDFEDRDHGSNELQNTLEQFSGYTKDDRLYLSGSFNGKPNTAYRYDLYLAESLPPGQDHRTQGSVHYDWFNFTTNAAGLYQLDTLFEDPWVMQWAPTYPFGTVTITGPEGTSSFSRLGIPPLGVDVHVRIDTLRSRVDPGGRVRIYATVRNLGGDPATTVTLRDTVSNFNLENVTVSKGVALIADSTFVATIPTLTFGEVIEYNAVGQALKTGPHHRRINAIPSENDKDLSNNTDTILLQVMEVNDVDDTYAARISIRLRSNNTVQLNGFEAGEYAVRCHDLLGRVRIDSEVRIGAGEPLELDLRPGVNMLEVSRYGMSLYRAKIMLRNR